jgi:hypothetical protein
MDLSTRPRHCPPAGTGVAEYAGAPYQEVAAGARITVLAFQPFRTMADFRKDGKVRRLILDNPGAANVA